jgi:hypothetical protein
LKAENATGRPPVQQEAGLLCEQRRHLLSTARVELRIVGRMTEQLDAIRAAPAHDAFEIRVVGNAHADVAACE